ncbi:hypothetical protein NIAS840_01831 [Ligilactobacillus salivarius NIAS840]|uniref:Uncharacterized protein n=1 Tax=Ligilactobacillus salivarius NIAS840 TaxID=1029822 RepID=F5VGB1_9LACO|nr:hypothetical protein NIAS840_01831 [Ligilactobacillus salivarius NIAS840]
MVSIYESIVVINDDYLFYYYLNEMKNTFNKKIKNYKVQKATNIDC